MRSHAGKGLMLQLTERERECSGSQPRLCHAGKSCAALAARSCGTLPAPTPPSWPFRYDHSRVLEYAQFVQASKGGACSMAVGPRSSGLAAGAARLLAQWVLINPDFSPPPPPPPTHPPPPHPTIPTARTAQETGATGAGPAAVALHRGHQPSHQEGEGCSLTVLTRP